MPKPRFSHLHHWLRTRNSPGFLYQTAEAPSHKGQTTTRFSASESWGNCCHYFNMHMWVFFHFISSVPLRPPTITYPKGSPGQGVLFILLVASDSPAWSPLPESLSRGKLGDSSSDATFRPRSSQPGCLWRRHHRSEHAPSLLGAWGHGNWNVCRCTVHVNALAHYLGVFH